MYLDLCTWQMDRNGLEVCISKTEKTEKSRFQKLKKSLIACFTTDHYNSFHIRMYLDLCT